MPLKHALSRFLQLESASGLLLIAAAALALVINNSPLDFLYNGLLDTRVAVQIGALAIQKPLLLWINDGLMALFFLTVGLELKREILEGQLARPAQIILPGAAAIGGMLVPALIYWFINRDDPAAISGWAIPMATDIAFALGVLGLLGSRVPASLKLFLMTLAIIDDLGAIIVIAIFYSTDLSQLSLILASIFLITLIVMNRLGVSKLSPYMVIGTCLWICVLKSGVHATLAGVVLAFTIPLRPTNGESSPAHALEQGLHPWVAFFILPLFAFANAGVPFSGMSLASFVDPVPLGIAAGLLLGKTLGVFGLTWLAVSLRIARLPLGANWTQVLGVSVVCGIGFTMSLFVGSLAFTPDSPYFGLDRVGILSGSLLAAVIGYSILALAGKKTVR
ncbi:Na+/H+ antiporter NhaA [Pseudomonas sp. N040]|uniref:Na+/H+ antiporter NhaA n=1 Tax=Pseudomonas sp. N040 TaxID=2785325 RepID=UPI0018A26DC9|nr:Na+/H+ antiporter NhaA [Pseudomonas sp. N040]MBF7730573.1 Na+/H+ antiporter NhaA [Pseudomonas sp. N040]MBW7014217.1 Na+/H+ antiporter NhaA [Pseudomonas sp. N040]